MKEKLQGEFEDSLRYVSERKGGTERIKGKLLVYKDSAQHKERYVCPS